MSRTIPHPNARHRVAVLGVLAGLLLALVLPAAAASAAAYRYWGYYTLSGSSWQFATKGPGQTTPADGSVEGYRFAVGAEGDTRMPRATPTFGDLCGSTKAQSGKKRVGVVLDYGRTADSANGTPPKPKGACALVATNATGAEVLAAVASVRADKGLVCAIDGYPSTGCGEAVKTVSAAAKAPDQPVQLTMPTSDKSSAATSSSTDSQGSHTGTWIAIAVVVLLALAIAITLLRRRRIT